MFQSCCSMGSTHLAGLRAAIFLVCFCNLENQRKITGLRGHSQKSNEFFRNSEQGMARSYLNDKLQACHCVHSMMECNNRWTLVTCDFLVLATRSKIFQEPPATTRPKSLPRQTSFSYRSFNILSPNLLFCSPDLCPINSPIR